MPDGAELRSPRRAKGHGNNPPPRVTFGAATQKKPARMDGVVLEVEDLPLDVHELVDRRYTTSK